MKSVTILHKQIYDNGKIKSMIKLIFLLGNSSKTIKANIPQTMALLQKFDFYGDVSRFLDHESLISRRVVWKKEVKQICQEIDWNKV